MAFSPSATALTHLSSAHHHHHLSFMMPGGAESGYSSGLSLSRPLDTFEVTRDASLATAEVQTTPRTSAAINYMSALQLSTPRMGRKGTPLKRQPFGQSAAVYETTPKKPKSHENIENETSYVSRSGSMKVPFRTRLDRSLSQTMSPLTASGGVDKLDCTFDAISSSTPIGQPFRAEFYEQQVEAIPQRNLTRSGGKNTRTKIIRKMQSFSPRKLMGQRAAKVPLREMDQNSVDFQKYSAGLFPVEEEESPIPKTEKGGAVKKVLFSEPVTAGGGAFCSGLRDLMFGAIKAEELKGQADLLDTTNTFDTSGGDGDLQRDQPAGACKHPAQETSSQLLDIYVTNLSNLDGGDSNSDPAAAEDGDVSMNTSMVERYFDELKRNTTQVQENSSELFVPVTTGDLLKANLMEEGEVEKQMEVEVATQRVDKPAAVQVVRQPMLLRKRKRPSTELIQGVLATPKKMRRSQSFHIGDGHSVMDENVDLSSVSSSQRCLSDLSSCDSSSYSSQLVSPTLQKLGGARKRLNYEPVPRNRCSPAKRALAFDGGVSRRRSVHGTQRLNIFRHLANCPPVRDYFFEFVDDKDLAAIYAVSRQCRAMIEGHPRLNTRRMQYLDAAWRKKENSNVDVFSAGTSPEDQSQSILRIQGEKSLVRIPLHNRNVDTSCASNISDTMSPPVSPSRRKFHENQKVSGGAGKLFISLIYCNDRLSLSLRQLVQQNPGAFFVSCPRCRASSVIEKPDELCLSQSTGRLPEENNRNSFNFKSMRSHSLCVSDLRSTSLMIPVRKQFSLPETNCLWPSAKEQHQQQGPEPRMGVCQSIQCGFRFCVHCSYAFDWGHKCIEIGTLSPLIKQSRQPRVVACSKQSKRNLKRL